MTYADCMNALHALLLCAAVGFAAERPEVLLLPNGALEVNEVLQVRQSLNF